MPKKLEKKIHDAITDHLPQQVAGLLKGVLIREIEWKTPGSDVVHSIPDVARVTIRGEHGEVTVGFDEGGSIESSFHGAMLFSREFGKEVADRRHTAIVDGNVRATDYLHVFLDTLNPGDRDEAVTMIVEQVLEDYPEVAEEFRRRVLLDPRSKR